MKLAFFKYDILALGIYVGVFFNGLVKWFLSNFLSPKGQNILSLVAPLEFKAYGLVGHNKLPKCKIYNFFPLVK